MRSGPSSNSPTLTGEAITKFLTGVTFSLPPGWMFYGRLTKSLRMGGGPHGRVCRAVAGRGRSVQRGCLASRGRPCNGRSPTCGRLRARRATCGLPSLGAGRLLAVEPPGQVSGRYVGKPDQLVDLNDVTGLCEHIAQFSLDF